MTRILKLVFIAQGLMAIMFGVAAMFWPGITELALAYLFATFLLLDGLLLAAGSRAWKGRAAHIRLVWGILQLLVGLYVGFNPEISFAVLIIVLGATIFARGLFSLAHAVTHHDAPPDERLLHGLLGAVGIVIGAIIGLQPAAGGLAFMWVVGLYAVITGALLIGLAFGIGQLSKRGHHTAIKF